MSPYVLAKKYKKRTLKPYIIPPGAGVSYAEYDNGCSVLPLLVMMLVNLSILFDWDCVLSKTFTFKFVFQNKHQFVMLPFPSSSSLETNATAPVCFVLK